MASPSARSPADPTAASRSTSPFMTEHPAQHMTSVLPSASWHRRSAPRRARVKRLQRPMPEVSGLSRRAGSSSKRLRRWMQDTVCRGEHKDVSPVEHVGHGRVSRWGRRARGWGGDRNSSPPDQRPAALLVAAGVVAVDGAALLGFAGWLLLRRTSEEPSNRGVFQGATAFIALMGLLVLVVAVALWLQRRRGLRCRRSFSCRARRDLRDGRRRILARRHAAWTGQCGGAACCSPPQPGRRWAGPENSAMEQREHGQHAAVNIPGRLEAELAEHLRADRFDGAFA
jgi:hypothetical protein